MRFRSMIYGFRYAANISLQINISPSTVSRSLCNARKLSLFHSANISNCVHEKIDIYYWTTRHWHNRKCVVNENTIGDDSRKNRALILRRHSTQRKLVRKEIISLRNLSFRFSVDLSHRVACCCCHWFYSINNKRGIQKLACHECQYTLSISCSRVGYWMGTEWMWKPHRESIFSLQSLILISIARPTFKWKLIFLFFAQDRFVFPWFFPWLFLIKHEYMTFINSN